MTAARERNLPSDVFSVRGAPTNGNIRFEARSIAARSAPAGPVLGPQNGRRQQIATGKKKEKESDPRHDLLSFAAGIRRWVKLTLHEFERIVALALLVGLKSALTRARAWPIFRPTLGRVSIAAGR